MFTSVEIFVWNVHQSKDFCVFVLSFNAGIFFIDVLFTSLWFFYCNVHQCMDFCWKCSPVYGFLCEMFTNVGFLCEMFTSLRIFVYLYCPSIQGFFLLMYCSPVYDFFIVIFTSVDFCVKCSPVYGFLCTGNILQCRNFFYWCIVHMYRIFYCYVHQCRIFAWNDFWVKCSPV
jgi:hypothetical protein